MRLVFSMVRPDGSASRDYTVEGEVLQFGRDEESDVVLDASNVSSKHAKICLINGLFVLQDLGSTNGTLLNGRKIEGSATLSAGCALQFGHTGPQLKVISLELSLPQAQRMQHPGFVRRYVLPLAVLSVVSVISVVVGVMAVWREKTPTLPPESSPQAATPSGDSTGGPKPNSSPALATTRINPPASRFAWVGLQDEGDIVLICSGVLLGEKQCLTCGFVANYSSEALGKKGLAGSRLVVGVHDEKNGSQWRLIEVIDDFKSIPEESPEIVLLSLKENVTSDWADRYEAADSVAWGNEFSTLGVGEIRLSCWGFALPKNVTTLSPNSAPRFCRADIIAKEFGTSRFQIEGKPSLNLIRISSGPNSSPGMIAFSKDGCILGMLTKDSLVPVDRLLFGFPQESRGLIQQ